MMSADDDTPMAAIEGTERDGDEQPHGNDRAEHRLFAYMLTRNVPPIIPSPVKREWMNDTTDHFAPVAFP